MMRAFGFYFIGCHLIAVVSALIKQIIYPDSKMDNAEQPVPCCQHPRTNPCVCIVSRTRDALDPGQVDRLVFLANYIKKWIDCRKATGLTPAAACWWTHCLCCKLYSKAFLTPPPYILSGRAPKAFWVVPCVGRSDHHFTEGIYLLLSKGLAPIVLTVPRNRDSDFITFPPCHSAVFNPSHFNRSPSNWVRDRSQRLYFIVSD